MLADEYPDFRRPEPGVGRRLARIPSPHVEDVDRIVEGAAAAGATVLRPVRDELYGDRTGMIADPSRPQVADRDPRGRRVAGGDAAALDRDARLISAPGVLGAADRNLGVLTHDAPHLFHARLDQVAVALRATIRT